jgi:hypothetical protein
MELLIKPAPGASWATRASFGFENERLLVDGKAYAGFLKIEEAGRTWMICDTADGQLGLCGEFFVRYPVCLLGPVRDREPDELFLTVKKEGAVVTSKPLAGDILMEYESDASSVEDNLEEARPPSSSSSDESDEHESSESEFDEDGISEISSIGDAISEASV